jgi:hypothetical protein
MPVLLASIRLSIYRDSYRLFFVQVVLLYVQNGLRPYLYYKSNLPPPPSGTAKGEETSQLGFFFLRVRQSG